MHPQLAEIEEELSSATARLKRIAERYSPEAWQARPTPETWSAADCVMHLNMTSAAYLPLLDEGLNRARSTPGRAPRRLRRDPVGWLIWQSVNPAGRLKVSTAPAFVPSAAPARDELTAEFDRLQSELVTRVRGAEGLPIQKVKIGSPFNPRAKYSLFSAFGILSAHEHRHLLQAERALASRA